MPTLLSTARRIVRALAEAFRRIGAAVARLLHLPQAHAVLLRREAAENAALAGDLRAAGLCRAAEQLELLAAAQRSRAARLVGWHHR